MGKEGTVAELNGIYSRNSANIRIIFNEFRDSAFGEITHGIFTKATDSGAYSTSIENNRILLNNLNNGIGYVRGIKTTVPDPIISYNYIDCGIIGGEYDNGIHIHKDNSNPLIVVKV